jgi:hypothetical protein
MWRGHSCPRKVGSEKLKSKKLKSKKLKSKKRPAYEPAFSFDGYTFNSISAACTVRPLIDSLPTLTGRLKRRGPALPGLKYRTPFFSSISG